MHNSPTTFEFIPVIPPGTWRPRLLSRLACSRPTTGTPVLSDIVPRAHHCWTYGLRSVPVATARVATTQTPARVGAAGPSASWRCRRSGQRLRQARSERRHAERVASQRDASVSATTAAPTGERSVSGPRYPIGLRGATAEYAANANASDTMRRVPPGRHVYVARDPSASAGDESSLSSLDALPPATLHGYADWDSSGVPDQ
jgi:hypothetical protein